MSQSAEGPSQIPIDLQNQLNSATALAQCYNLIQQAPFPFGYATSVDRSLKFLQSLHEQVMTEAKKHPSAHMVPALAPPPAEVTPKKTSQKRKKHGSSK